jgi:hypothetical protein
MMKIIDLKWYRFVCRVGLCAVIILCTLSCQSARKSVERIAQSDMACKTMIQAEWGNDMSELGYVPEDQSSLSPHKPFRFQIDNTGNLFVADLHNERILKFTSEGTFLRGFSVPMSESREYIVDIAVGSERIIVATTDYIHVFDQSGILLQTLEWPVDVGQYALCSEDMAGRKVQIDEEGNVYACGAGGFERGGTIVQFDSKGHSRNFFEGSFEHFVVGWDGFVYIQRSDNSGAVSDPSDSQIIKFDSQGNQIGKIMIRGYDLVDAGLTYPGILVAVDASGNLYGGAVTTLKNGKAVPKEVLVQINAEGSILRIIEHKDIRRPAIDVVDREGSLYLWHFANVPSDPAEIWRCSP